MGSGGSTRTGEVVVDVDGCSHSGSNWVRDAGSGGVMWGVADDECTMGKRGNGAAVLLGVLGMLEVVMGGMISQKLNEMFSISCSCTESSKSPSTSCSISSRPSMAAVNKRNCRLEFLLSRTQGLRSLGQDAALHHHAVETKCSGS